jgi:hypothetical protein
MKIGIEIEAVYNKTRFPGVNVGGYHGSSTTSGLPGWTCQSDASLDTSGDACFSVRDTCEFVSDVSISVSEFLRKIAVFKQFFSRGGTVELHDALFFNSSCGCHVHFTPGDNFEFFKKAGDSVFPKIRDTHFELLSASGLPVSKLSVIKNHYSRSFAKSFRPEHRKNDEKHVEFNLGSERSGRGLEFRGFNMRGISSWAEFDALIDVFIRTCLQSVIVASRWTDSKSVVIEPARLGLVKNLTVAVVLKRVNTQIPVIIKDYSVINVEV